MNQLKRYVIIGAVFVLIAGTCSHFLYGWTNNNFIIGAISPVNESTWEHMKLVFFPMLVYSFFIIVKLKGAYPYITSSMLYGTLLGTLLIPFIFYTYTGILGYNIFIFDFLTFVLSVIIAFYVVYKLALRGKKQNDTILLLILTVLFVLCFVSFTYYTPNIALFTDPTLETVNE